MSKRADRRAEVLNRSASALSWVFLLGGGFAFVSTLRAARASYWAGPVGDLWYFVPTVRRFAEGEGSLAELWLPFGGHRLFVPKLLYLADYLYLDGRNLLPLVAGWLLQCAVAALLVGLIWRQRSVVGAAATRFIAGSTLVLLFSASQLENFVHAWNVHWFVATAATCASIAALAHSANARGGAWFASSLLAASIASLSMANGLLCWPILLLLAIGLGLPRRRIGWLAAVGVVLALGFFVDYSTLR